MSMGESLRDIHLSISVRPQASYSTNIECPRKIFPGHRHLNDMLPAKMVSMTTTILKP